MRFRISEEAAIDLEEIWLYTSEYWSIDQADRYLNRLLDEIEYLCQNPRMGEDYSDIREGYFRLRVKSHLIFYRINLRKEVIEIIRVLHQRMDIANRLNK
ncbi:MAG TPA: type II toxin-antitoxin system RelE/ParE family toxin [Aequorivita sp.]|nr:type II toxin-antitoxin system RelE/ParE family toxin [Aequorivita sp.]